MVAVVVELIRQSFAKLYRTDLEENRSRGSERQPWLFRWWLPSKFLNIYRRKGRGGSLGPYSK